MQLGYIPGQRPGFLLVTAHQLHNVACSGPALTVDAPHFQPHSRCAESTINGASMSPLLVMLTGLSFIYIYILYICVVRRAARIVQCSTMSNSSARVPESSGNREDRLQCRRERERACRAFETAEQRGTAESAESKR